MRRSQQDAQASVLRLAESLQQAGLSMAELTEQVRGSTRGIGRFRDALLAWAQDEERRDLTLRVVSLVTGLAVVAVWMIWLLLRLR